MSNLFDLEQQILNCWNVTDEIDQLLWAMDRGLTEDELSNHLIGLKQIYHVKFQRLFELYENHLQEIYQAKSSLVPAKGHIPSTSHV